MKIFSYEALFSRKIILEMSSARALDPVSTRRISLSYSRIFRNSVFILLDMFIDVISMMKKKRSLMKKFYSAFSIQFFM